MPNDQNNDGNPSSTTSPFSFSTTPNMFSSQPQSTSTTNLSSSQSQTAPTSNLSGPQPQATPSTSIFFSQPQTTPTPNFFSSPSSSTPNPSNLFSSTSSSSPSSTQPDPIPSTTPTNTFTSSTQQQAPPTNLFSPSSSTPASPSQPPTTSTSSLFTKPQFDQPSTELKLEASIPPNSTPPITATDKPLLTDDQLISELNDLSVSQALAMFTEDIKNNVREFGNFSAEIRERDKLLFENIEKVNEIEKITEILENKQKEQIVEFSNIITTQNKYIKLLEEIDKNLEETEFIIPLRKDVLDKVQDLDENLNKTMEKLKVAESSLNESFNEEGNELKMLMNEGYNKIKNLCEILEEKDNEIDELDVYCREKGENIKRLGL